MSQAQHSPKSSITVAEGHESISTRVNSSSEGSTTPRAGTPSRGTTPIESPSCSPRLKASIHTDPGSDLEDGNKAMSSRSSKHHDSSSKKSSSSKSKSRSDDWTDVTEPEERRRIQNRIAQRKFREKAKEQKERAERDALNEKHAVGSYQTPDMAGSSGYDEDLSGLPWGSMSMNHVISRGYERESRRGSKPSSGRDDYTTYDTQSSANWTDSQQQAGYGASGSGGDDTSYDEAAYYYYYDPSAEDGGSGSQS